LTAEAVGIEAKLVGSQLESGVEELHFDAPAAFGAQLDPVVADDVGADAERLVHGVACDSNIRVSLQRTDDKKQPKERMHLETDDVKSRSPTPRNFRRHRWDHQQERGYDFWVLRDPWATNSASFNPSSPHLLVNAVHGEPNEATLRYIPTHSLMAEYRQGQRVGQTTCHAVRNAMPNFSIVADDEGSPAVPLR
jgi:hypothetical protein